MRSSIWVSGTALERNSGQSPGICAQCRRKVAVRFSVVASIDSCSLGVGNRNERLSYLSASMIVLALLKMMPDPW